MWGVGNAARACMTGCTGVESAVNAAPAYMAVRTGVGSVAVNAALVCIAAHTGVGNVAVNTALACMSVQVWGVWQSMLHLHVIYDSVYRCGECGCRCCICMYDRVCRCEECGC